MPPRPPVRAAAEAKANRRGRWWVLWRVVAKTLTGMSFCQVERTRHMGQERALMTEGNQKWQGGRPSFRRRPISSMRPEIGQGVVLSLGEIVVAAARRIIPEPNA